MSERMTLRIYGQVQGVNFRYLTCEYARTLGLCGYVKNELDRSVTVVAEGEKKHLQELLHFCYNGIRYAQIEDINIKYGKMRNEFMGFDIIYLR